MKKVQATLGNEKIHGEYVGISTTAVRDGASFEESRVSLSVKHDGVYLGSQLPIENSSPPTSTVHFSPDWIFSLKNWGVDHCLSLRQHLNSDLAQLIFDFTPTSMIPPIKETNFFKKIAKLPAALLGRTRIDATMYLGEGMFAILGLFIRKDRHADADKALTHLYEIIKESFAVEDSFDGNESKSWLLDMDMDIAHIVMDSPGNSSAKIKVIKKVGHNLWTAEEKIINERIRIIAKGLDSNIATVQIEALNFFIIGSRVTQGVPLLIDFFYQRKMLNNAVLSQALDAVRCMLYEAHEHNKRAMGLISHFGTTDAADILKVSCGILDPEQADLISKHTSRRPSMRWSLEDHRLLRLILEEVIGNELALTDKDKKECTRALTDYAF